jgi:hypothetical protein
MLLFLIVVIFRRLEAAAPAATPTATSKNLPKKRCLQVGMRYQNQHKILIFNILHNIQKYF